MTPRWCWNQRGMGLVEVLVAAAMLGGLSLVVMQLTDNSQKTVTRMEKGIETIDLDAEINGVLSNKTSCTASLHNSSTATGGTAVALTAFTGAARYPASGQMLQVRDYNIITSTASVVYPVTATTPFKRNLVSLVDIYLTDFSTTATTTAGSEKPAYTARLKKVYRYRVGNNHVQTKTKSALVRITPQDPPNAHLTKSCVLVGGESDSVWVVDDYGIYYDSGVVAIAKRANVMARQNLVLDVSGGVVFGPDSLSGSENSVSGSTNNNNHVLGGRSNIVTGTTNSNIIVGGSVNRITQGSDNYVFGGYNNTVSSSAVGGGGTSNNVILGGYNNTLQQQYSGMIGGNNNQIDAASGYSVVGGGNQNRIFSGPYGAIAGGQLNIVNATHSAVVGGTINTAAGGHHGRPE